MQAALIIPAVVRAFSVNEVIEMAERYAGIHVMAVTNMEQFRALFSEQAVYVNRETLVSVFDDSLRASEIEQKARMVSMRVNAPVVFAQSTGDMLLMGQCIMGFTMLRHCIGDAKEAGIAENHAQSKEFAQKLGIEGKTEEIRRFVRERDVKTASQQLEALLGFALKQA